MLSCRPSVGGAFYTKVSPFQMTLASVKLTKTNHICHISSKVSKYLSPQAFVVVSIFPSLDLLWLVPSMLCMVGTYSICDLHPHTSFLQTFKVVQSLFSCDHAHKHDFLLMLTALLYSLLVQESWNRRPIEL